MFRFLLFTLLASFRLATSLPASTGVGEGIIEWIKQLVQDATSDWDKCTILKADDYQTYYSLTRYNTAESTICYINSTTIYDVEYPVPLMTPGDGDVLKCMLGLFHTTGLSCIAVSGSSCDNGYVNNGGQILNMRKFAAGPGQSDSNKIAIDEYNSGVLAVDTLIGQHVTGNRNTLSFEFWDPNGNHLASSPNALVVDFVHPNSPAC